MSFEPSPKQVLALWNMLFTGEEPRLSNLQPDLTSLEIRELENAGLIELDRRKRSKHIVLTEKAWAWTATHLDADVFPSKTAVKALRGLLNSLKCYLETTECTLAEFVSLGQDAFCDDDEEPAPGENFELRFDGPGLWAGGRILAPAEQPRSLSDRNPADESDEIRAEISAGEADEPGPDALIGEPDEPQPEILPGEIDEPDQEVLPGEADEPGPDSLIGEPDEPQPEILPGEADEPGPEVLPGEADEPGPDALIGEPDEPQPEVLPGEADEPGPDALADEADEPTPDVLVGEPDETQADVWGAESDETAPEDQGDEFGDTGSDQDQDDELKADWGEPSPDEDILFEVDDSGEPEPETVRPVSPDGAGTGDGQAVDPGLSDDLAARIKAAYTAVTGGRSNVRVRLSVLHDYLEDIPLDLLKTKLIDLQREGRFKMVLWSLDDPRDIGPEDERAAVEIAGIRRHIVYMEA